jgi:integrase
MAKIAFHLNMSKRDKNDFVPIRTKIAVESKAVMKNLPFKVKVKKNNKGSFEPVKWDKGKQRFAGFRKEDKNADYYNKANAFLDDYTSKANNFFNDCLLNDIPLTIPLIKDFFNGITPNLKNKKVGFWIAWDEFLTAGELTYEANTIRSRKSKKKKFEEFQNDTEYKMTFETINLEFWDKLTEYILFTKEHEFNYLPALIKQLKAFMKWSYERGYHNSKTYKKFSVQEKEGSIIYLTYAELKQLVNFQFKNKRLSRVRDFFCFGCLTGARYSDLIRLTKDNIAESTLKFTTEKTNKDVAIPIFPELQTIIDRYPDQYKLLPSYSDQKARDYIKEACQLAGIKAKTEKRSFKKNETIKTFRPKYELIGTHTARKTFVCLAHERGMDIKTIMDITGIKDQRTLSRYLNVSINTKKQHLSNTFGDLSPKEESDETLTAMRETLLKAGFDQEKINKIIKEKN